MEVQLCKTNYCFDWAVGLRRPAVCSRCNLNRSPINNDYHFKLLHTFSHGPFSITQKTKKILLIQRCYFCTHSTAQFQQATKPPRHVPDCIIYHLGLWRPSHSTQNKGILSPVPHHLIYFPLYYCHTAGTPVTNNTKATRYSERASGPSQPSLPLMSVRLQICS